MFCSKQNQYSLCAHATDVILKNDVVVVDSEIHWLCEYFWQLASERKKKNRIISNQLLQKNPMD